MATDKDKRQKTDAPAQPRPPVEWGGEPAEDEWTQDSSLPASDTLSDVPTPSEIADAGAAEAEDDDADTDDTLPTEIPAISHQDLDEPARRRSKTIARKQMLRERRRMVAQGLLPEILDYERPSQRAQCRSDKRPCLYVSCRYHLYLDVNPITGSIKINFPDKEVWQLAETCALDVAERGGITLEEVGDIMNLTRERIRQVEVSGLEKLREGDASLETFLDGRELVVGGPSPEGRASLPVLDD